jgi:hypothetical protein
MIMATKNDIFKEHLSSYLKADKQRKGEILKHICFVTGVHRKAAIRKFGNMLSRHPYKEEQRGRETVYTPDVTAALKDIWEAGNEVCGELLYPVINEYIHILRRDGMWKHGDEATSKLRAMSEGTVKRRVRGFMKIRRRKKGISTTKPSHLKQIVPVFSGPWTDKPPGYGQLDTVMHSDSALGDAVYTVNYTDAATCLIIPRAQWNKGQEATRESMKYIKEKLPFPWLGAHPDTGSEFLNWFVKEWCDKERIELSRSRPGRKNDNMYVEERNGHVIRKTVGYIRLDCKEAVRALNALYDVLMPYLIHFVAVRRTLGKEKVLSKYKRRYEKTAKTPYQRIREHPAIPEEVKEKLTQEHERLNPLVLKKEIDRRLTKVYDVQKRFGSPKK